MPLPMVSVGLPVFNGERYLRNALNSLLSQEYTDFELVIADNASTDSTPDICRQYAAQDRRIRYSRNERNIGAAPNHNLVFTLARGQFFKWAAHDDEYPKHMLARCVETLLAAPASVCLVYTHCEIIDADGRAHGMRSDHVELRHAAPHRRLARLLNRITMYNVTYGLMRSSMLRRTRLEGAFLFSDYVLMAELAMLGELREIPEPLLRLRCHSGRSVSANPTPQALQNFHDPSATRKFAWLSPWLRADLELVRSGYLIPSTVLDKCLCLLTVLTVPHLRRFRTMGGRQKQRVLNCLRSRPATHRVLQEQSGLPRHDSVGQPTRLD